jgi:hypothetical protein
MGPQQSYNYIADWMRSTGWPSYLIDSTLDAISAPAVAAHDAAVLRELVGEVSPRAANAQRMVERESAQKDVAMYEAMLKNEPRKYWASAAYQESYRQALERSLIGAPVMSAVEAPAAAPATPAPAAEPPPPAAAPAAPVSVLAVEQPAA